jgi:hypothetical protein
MTHARAERWTGRSLDGEVAHALVGDELLLSAGAAAADGAFRAWDGDWRLAGTWVEPGRLRGHAYNRRRPARSFHFLAQPEAQDLPARELSDSELGAVAGGGWPNDGVAEGPPRC